MQIRQLQRALSHDPAERRDLARSGQVRPGHVSMNNPAGRVQPNTFLNRGSPSATSIVRIGETNVSPEDAPTTPKEFLSIIWENLLAEL